MNRRTFFGAGAVFALLPTSAQTQQLLDPDPVTEALLAEVVRRGRELSLTAPIRADTVAALATIFRLHAAHLRATDTDQMVTQGVTELLRDRRDLIDDPNVQHQYHEQHRAMAEQVGLTVPPDMADLTPEQYQAGLTRILAGGAVSDVLDEAATVFESLRDQLAKSATPDGLIRRVQLDTCTSLRAICELLKAITASVCVMAMAGVAAMVPLCAVLMMENMVACLAAWAMGC